MLTRHSHPLAWVAAGMHLYKKARGAREEADVSFEVWPSIGDAQRCALVQLLMALNAGEVVEKTPGRTVRKLGEFVFGSHENRNSSFGPYGDGPASILIDWIWDHCPSLEVASSPLSLHQDVGHINLQSTARAERLAQDCLALKKAGCRVGLLVEGPPGSGKSQALLHVASVLGGRTLRASLFDIEVTQFATLALVLKPDVIIFDDIDRTDTANLLDAVDRFGNTGISVLASANQPSSICTALLRAGRIDDHHRFGAIEPDVLERLVVDPGDRERLAPFTVASVVRYLEIRKVLGEERAERFLSNQAMGDEVVEEPAPPKPRKFTKRAQHLE